MTGARNVLLLATAQRVYGFDFDEILRVAIGRHQSNDLQFDSRNVSNYHAEIVSEPDGLVLRDLGSTNGTYVNENRIRQVRLAHGDRIRIGRHEIGVLLTGATPAVDALQVPLSVGGQQGEFGRTDGNGGLTLGRLLVGMCRKGESMLLMLMRGTNEEIPVYILNGRIVHAQAGKARAEKALYRAFEWYKGAYRIEPYPKNDGVARTMGIPVEALVQEGERQAAELDELMSRIPPPEVTLRLRESSKIRICDLTAAELDVFKGLIRYGTLGETMEESPMTDLTVMSLVHSLLQKKVFEVEEGASLLQQTNAITRA
ncbi:MAG TPA: FHA domain-containing protein [Vicinamibacteria bacterium]|nr:FHA domain-containing protein [Vicinamibacteria bacterium]